MAGAEAGERDERRGVTAAEARRRRIAARAGRSGLRLVAPPEPSAASEGGQSKDQARLLGAYNLYNG